jgi:trk system potassium uptake protein
MPALHYYSDSMVRYNDSFLLNMTICGLILAGGIGFPVLYDLQSWFMNQKNKRTRLSVQTKTVLVTSMVLIVSGALIFALLEQQAIGHAPSLQHRVLAPLFQSITCRTAGFNTVDIASLKDATLSMMIFSCFSVLHQVPAVVESKPQLWLSHGIHHDPNQEKKARQYIQEKHSPTKP